MKKRCWAMAALCLLFGCDREKPQPEVPVFSEPVLSATSEGVPVHTYGYTDVLAEGPTLIDSLKIQANNDRPFVRMHPKPSPDIRFNRLGATAPRLPRTSANDYLPLEPVHLIDGDAATCWSSKTVSQAAAEPAWIRIDLPVEKEIAGISLRKRMAGGARNRVGSVSPQPGAVEVGMGLPGHLVIKVSRDAKSWTTLFDGDTCGAAESDRFVRTFDPCRAKQIWIIGTELPKVENWLHSFSIAEVEVRDVRGNNLALVSRGAGVTVSSTQHSYGQTREEHRWLWPIHVDLGLKWVRVGYHDDPVNWHWVEKEKGKLEIDPEADSAITYLVRRGIDIDFVLAFGNRLYTMPDPVRRLPQLWEWYFENPRPPTTPEALEAWERYVRFVVRHFRGRVKVFEIWNEWNIPDYWGDQPDVGHYVTLARRTIPIIRDECPEARVMLGSVAGVAYGMSRWTAEELRSQEKDDPFLRAAAELAGEVDIIGWHPFYQTDPEHEFVKSYPDDIRAFKAWAARQGFRGGFSASEWTYAANYPPPTPPNWWGDFQCTELDKAKYIARFSVLHTALDIDSFFCETWSNYYPLDLTLLRRGFSGSPVSVQQPQAAYYVMRNLATALEELRPADFECRIEGETSKIELYKLARSGERVVALWIPGRADDDFRPLPLQIEIAGDYRSVWGYDCLNGVLQELSAEKTANGVRIGGVLIKDYPTLIRLRE
jgi:hypothetical protein